MLKVFISLTIALFSMQSFAGQTSLMGTIQQLQINLASKAAERVIDWKVGDSASYNMNAGFIQGTMVMSVASYTQEGIWLNQDADMGFLGKQKIEMLMDPENGQIKKVIANGQPQEVPKTPNIEIVETKTESITVPAGSFDCAYARIKDKDANSESEVWLSEYVALSGMVKSIQPSQLGQVTLELTSYNKQ